MQGLQPCLRVSAGEKTELHLAAVMPSLGSGAWLGRCEIMVDTDERNDQFIKNLKGNPGQMCINGKKYLSRMWVRIGLGRQIPDRTLLRHLLSDAQHLLFIVLRLVGISPCTHVCPLHDNNMVSKTTKLGGAASDVVVGKTAVSQVITLCAVSSRLNRFAGLLARLDADDVRRYPTSCREVG